MKKIFAFFSTCFLFFNSLTFSQHQFDTLSIRHVAKGVQHISITEPNMPWTLDLLKIDLAENILKVEAGISKNRITGFEKTSTISKRSNYNGHHVVGAINGGFFSGTGKDVGIQIREGEIVTTNNNWSAIGFSSNKIPFIERLSLQSKIITNNNATKSINGINKVRDANQLVFYNSYFGSSTTTNQYGSEVMIEPISNWMVNDTNACIVVSKAIDKGNMALSKGNAVLSGHGTSKDFINSNIEVGDTVFIVHKISPAPEYVTTLLNGYPKIVSGGKNCALACYADEGGSSTFAKARHPRTAAGFSENKQFLYLITVDGRQATSKGMSLPELADFLVGIGVYRAVNLDGGGSSTMVVRNQIVNSPSDAGGERSVANSLMIVSQDSVGEKSNILIEPKFLKLNVNESFNFQFHGIDEFYNFFPVTKADNYWIEGSDSCTIEPSGYFTAGNQIDTVKVIVHYGGMKDTATVIINGVKKIEVYPNIVTTDTSSTVSFKVKAYDINNWVTNTDKSKLQWKVENNAIGIIDSNGLFKGIKSGTTKVFVEYNSVKDTAIINVDLKEGGVLLNKFDNINEWTLTESNLDSAGSSIEINEENFTEGSTSLKLSYKYLYKNGNRYWAYLNTKTKIDGVLNNLKIDINGNDFKHSVAFVVENYNGDEYAILTNSTLSVSSNFDTLSGNFEKPIPLHHTTDFYFPIRLKQIAISFSNDRKTDSTYTGSIYFDNLRVNYKTPTSVNRPIKNSTIYFFLSQNYPNPFNPTTTIRYSIPLNRKSESSKVKLIVYDTLGQTVSTLVNKNQSAGNYNITFDASKFASGVYFYTLSVGSFKESKKMILLR